MWIGGFTVVMTILAVILVIVAARGKKPVPPRVLLELDLEKGVVENMPSDPFAKLSGERASLHDITFALERAESDPRVAGLVARIGAPSKSAFGIAQIQELRDAVVRFRQKGKFALAFAETFGEFSGGTGSYYLATAFDEIWLQPSGDIGLTGMYLESTFVKGALDKLGVKPHMDHRKEYKNAMNIYTEQRFTPAHREAMQRIGESLFGQIVQGIAQGRKLQPDAVRALVDRAPFLGDEAVKEKLVDGVAYRDEVYAKARERAGGAELLYLSKYLERAEAPHKKGKRIALIYGTGPVVRGKSDFDPFSGSSTMGSDTVAGAFRAATSDKDVKAILFRVDSPGGSYVASDSIWQEVSRARKAGKPVVVSMGNVAGSGGYFVAMAADKIVAQPATITGSIGVLAGKMILTDLLENKLGVTHDAVQFGKNATFWSTNKDYSPEEWARFQAWLDRIYDDFTSKVALGRKLDKAKVLEIAKGRIWSGEDAKQRGLVDELGGLHTALRLTKQLVNIPDGEDVELKEFPPEKSTFKALVAKLSGKESDNSEKEERGTETRLEMGGLRGLRAAHKALDLAQRLGVLDEPGTLTAPEVEVRF
jgi:protease-4